MFLGMCTAPTTFSNKVVKTKRKNCTSFMTAVSELVQRDFSQTLGSIGIYES